MNYVDAKKEYAKLGIDTDKAIEKIGKMGYNKYNGIV